MIGKPTLKWRYAACLTHPPNQTGSNKPRSLNHLSHFPTSLYSIRACGYRYSDEWVPHGLLNVTYHYPLLWCHLGRLFTPTFLSSVKTNLRWHREMKRRLWRPASFLATLTMAPPSPATVLTTGRRLTEIAPSARRSPACMTVWFQVRSWHRNRSYEVRGNILHSYVTLVLSFLSNEVFVNCHLALSLYHMYLFCPLPHSCP